MVTTKLHWFVILPPVLAIAAGMFTYSWIEVADCANPASPPFQPTITYALLAVMTVTAAVALARAAAPVRGPVRPVLLWTFYCLTNVVAFAMATPMVLGNLLCLIHRHRPNWLPN